MQSDQTISTAISSGVSIVGWIISGGIVIIGWLFAHKFASNRDRRNKQREIRISYLVEAYRDIGLAASRDKNSDQFKKLESAFHNIQLFGSSSQLDKFHAAVDRWKIDGGADLSPLLSDLRDDLRNELDLPPSKIPFTFFRT